MRGKAGAGAGIDQGLQVRAASGNEYAEPLAHAETSSPTTQACSPAARKAATVASASSLAVAATMPGPQLMVRRISSSSTGPVSCSHLNKAGRGQDAQLNLQVSDLGN